MADLLDLALLALVDGISVVLPVNVAARAQLFASGAPEAVTAFAVALGTALALAAYLWRDLAAMGLGVARLFKGRIDPGARLAGQVALATLPALAASWHWGGAALAAGGDALVGGVALGLGLLLLLADQLSMTFKRIEHMGGGGALFLGLVQALAILPGLGRPALAVLAARLLGYERPDAFRLSLLLGLPLILLAALGYGAAAAVGPLPLGSAAATAGAAFLGVLAALAAVGLWLRRRGFLPFALVHIALGALLLARAWTPA